MRFLSIILPVYNVEEYIVKCLDSIYAQGVDEACFEVIAVVDGSPDNSLRLIENYTISHENLYIISKENGGVSSARNRGIEVANGKYLMFVDPDDTLFVDSLASVIDTLCSACADIIIYRSFLEKGHKELYPWINKLRPNVQYTGIEVFDKGYSRGSVCGGVFGRDFLQRNKISFPLGVKNSEDSIFFMQCQMKAQSVLFSNIELYSVFSRNDSASRKINKERLRQWFEALKLTRDIKLKCNNDNELAMIDSIHYAIISEITNRSIQLLGWNARSFLIEQGIKEYLPISLENIKRSSLLNRLIKHTLNYSFFGFFIISYFRRRIF